MIPFTLSSVDTSREYTNGSSAVTMFDQDISPLVKGDYPGVNAVPPWNASRWQPKDVTGLKPCDLVKRDSLRMVRFRYEVGELDMADEDMSSFDVFSIDSQLSFSKFTLGFIPYDTFASMVFTRDPWIVGVPSDDGLLRYDFKVPFVYSKTEVVGSMKGENVRWLPQDGFETAMWWVGTVRGLMSLRFVRDPKDGSEWFESQNIGVQAVDQRLVNFRGECTSTLKRLFEDERADLSHTAAYKALAYGRMWQPIVNDLMNVFVSLDDRVTTFGPLYADLVDRLVSAKGEVLPIARIPAEPASGVRALSVGENVDMVVVPST